MLTLILNQFGEERAAVRFSSLKKKVFLCREVEVYISDRVELRLIVLLRRYSLLTIMDSWFG